MAKFRKKPIVVEAVQFTGDNWAEMHEFTGHSDGIGTTSRFDLFVPLANAYYDIDRDVRYTALVWDKLHATWVRVGVHQWVIKGARGEFYPCAPDVFEESYELIDWEHWSKSLSDQVLSRQEIKVRDSMGRPIMNEDAEVAPDEEVEEPTEPGFYKYSGGADHLIFLLAMNYDTTVQWYAIVDNGTMDSCDWGYIEQALGVWKLVKI